MENNEIIEQEKTEKQTPFLKRIKELEIKVEKLESKINTILLALKSRR